MCWRILPIVALLIYAPLVAQEAAHDSYSYLTSVEGSADVVQRNPSTRTPAEPNLPILVGDLVSVDRGGRVALLLSDRSLIRLDEDTELLFEAIAYSPDRDDEESQLNLRQGRIFVTFSDRLGDQPLRIDTPNSTIYLQTDGAYRVTGNSRDWTQLVVREGFAEVVTRRGSSIVRAGEQLEVEGEIWTQQSLASASPEAAIELWSRQPRARLQTEGYDDLEEPVRSRAGDLAEHGDWVVVEDRRAWRPTVTPSWRPYWQGRWAHTPSGLYWVSYDPWSSVTFHYGSWDHHYRYGWVWYPSYTYAPAHVYWYWGPSYAAWIPTGYYRHFYGHHRYGSHYGAYGYAGGAWHHYSRWTFCPTRHIGHHRQHHYHGDHHRARRELNTPAIPRGILTTDTRRVTRRRLQEPSRLADALLPPGANATDLPDVTPFVARQRDLPRRVIQRMELSPSDLDASSLRRPVRRRPVSAPADEGVARVPAQLPRAVGSSPEPLEDTAATGTRVPSARRPVDRDRRDGNEPQEGRTLPRRVRVPTAPQPREVSDTPPPVAPVPSASPEDRRPTRVRRGIVGRTAPPPSAEPSSPASTSGRTGTARRRAVTPRSSAPRPAGAQAPSGGAPRPSGPSARSAPSRRPSATRSGNARSSGRASTPRATSRSQPRPSTKAKSGSSSGSRSRASRSRSGGSASSASGGSSKGSRSSASSGARNRSSGSASSSQGSSRSGSRRARSARPPEL